ncbi:DMT family transporter [Streptomyces sp. WMMC500]|uniref:DMT family transporter n=1 Tax=Streptomyces sp. WMMC500 TaxID=3015154 RepID=UPI00248CD39B|nr:DMT family transporter [Streptomyces sp. WMMC500]WBB58548.1 DMT family transporter [Streptomyces sp. WMMC500]
MKPRFDPLTAAAIAVAVVSISATAPLTAAASASPLAMAFWRNALGFATLGLLLLMLRRREVVRVARGERGLLRREQRRSLVFGFLAATSLALHFAAFMTSTRMTTVAISTALVATQPVWQALIAAGQGVRFGGATWAGLSLAVLGAAAAAGPDIESGGTALMGDLLALAGAVAGAGYTALSQKARTDLSTPLYSTVTSLVCGLELLLVCWLAGIPLTGFDRSTQLSLLGLLLLPQLLGLGLMNFALGRTSATTMSVVLLLETPVAAVAAWLLMGQSIEPAAGPGLLLILVGVTAVVRIGDAEQPAPRRQGRHRKGTLMFPNDAPHTVRSPSLIGERGQSVPVGPSVAAWSTPQAAGPYAHHAEPGPETVWRDVGEDDTPTMILAYHHAAGAFDLMYRQPSRVYHSP